VYKLISLLKFIINICGSFDMYGFTDIGYKNMCEPYLKYVNLKGALK
jgi:hypothetical protein